MRIISMMKTQPNPLRTLHKDAFSLPKSMIENGTYIARGKRPQFGHVSCQAYRWLQSIAQDFSCGCRADSLSGGTNCADQCCFLEGAIFLFNNHRVGIDRE